MSAGHRKTTRRSCVCAGLFALAVSCLAGFTTAASAQNLFEILFGGFRRALAPPPGTTAYANPDAPASDGVFRRRPASSAGPAVSYCVRTCDGRFFPIQRQSNPAAICSALCPASKTTIFFGGSIDGARASDGTRYADLAAAHVYRQKVVAGCTCNGRDPFGLASIDVDNDPTLKPGDIVATRDGLMAYRGRDQADAAQYTPVGSYSGLSAGVRKRLSSIRIDLGYAPRVR